jgi:hypothetical protein
MRFQVSEKSPRRMIERRLILLEESPNTTFHDAQIPDIVYPEPFSQASLEQLLVPIEPLPTRSPPSAFDLSVIDETCGSRSHHCRSNHRRGHIPSGCRTSPGLILPEDPIPNEIDCEANDTESKPEFT